MANKLTTLMTIAGSDPMGGAGIQSDIRVGSRMGLHVCSAITAITAQNSKGFTDLCPVAPNILEAQIHAIVEDVIPDAIKIGMLGSVENMKVVSEALKKQRAKEIPVVIDPIFFSTIDEKCLVENGETLSLGKLYNDLLFPYATVITPNLQELNLILSNYTCSSDKIKDLRKNINCKNVIVTNYDSSEEKISDYFFTEKDIFIEKHDKVSCLNLHGTGCCYSTLLGVYLALGYPIRDAFISATNEMSSIIENSCYYRLGKSTYGPLNINNYLHK